MDLLPRVVEEAVGGARIDLPPPGLPELLERLLEPLDVVPGDPDVRVAVDVEDRAGQVLERGLVGDLAIVGRGGPDVLAAAGGQERGGGAPAASGGPRAGPPPAPFPLPVTRPDPAPFPHTLVRSPFSVPSFLIWPATPRRSSASRTVMWN